MTHHSFPLNRESTLPWRSCFIAPGGQGVSACCWAVLPKNLESVVGKQGRLRFRIGLLLFVACLILASSIPIKIMGALRRAPEPQAILILDGNDRRVQFGATFASLHAELPVWISGYCAKRAGVYKAFETADVADDRVHFDLRATDTVTHFTTLASEYGEWGIEHVYVVTSDYHMARARAIATVVFGSRGIAMTPVAEPTHLQPWETKESWIKVGRDTLRSLLWLVVGRTGAKFNGRTQADYCQV